MTKQLFSGLVGAIITGVIATFIADAVKAEAAATAEYWRKYEVGVEAQLNARCPH